MPSITMTIASVSPPPAGKKRGSIYATNGDRLGVFPEMIGTFQPGQTYAIEYAENDWQGTKLRNVVSAKPVAQQQPVPQQQRQAAQQQQPALQSTLPPDYNRQTHPVDSKRMFTCAALVAFIGAGRVELEERSLANATSMLMRLHDWAFEQDGRTKTH